MSKLVTCILLLAVVGGSGVAWKHVHDRGVRVHEGGASPSEYAKVLRLDDGEAGHVALDYGSDIRVWWRGVDDENWSAPEVITGGDGRYLTSYTARAAGTTLAIRAYYSTVLPSDDAPQEDEPAIRTSVFIVCVPRSCTVSDHVEHVSEPPCERGSCTQSRPESKGVNQVSELSADGDQVFFGNTDRGYVIWDREYGLRVIQAEGIPSDAQAGAPMLAPDGTMRLVSGRRAGNGCELTLLTTNPVADSASILAYVPQATTRVPTETGDCATTLEAFTSDQVIAHTDTWQPGFFVRGGSWHPTTTDPTGILRYPVELGRRVHRNYVRTGYWHWREVVTASPDGRRLIAQVHFPGEPTWTRPTTVATAPPGWSCKGVAPTSTPADEPFYVSMQCLDEEQRYVGVHAVTEDGIHWSSAVGDSLPTRVGDDLYFGGSPAHRWTPEDGLTSVGPPVPDNSETFLLRDGTLVLVTARPAGDRCALEIRVADDKATQWSAPAPGSPVLVPKGDPCAPVGQAEGRSVSLYFDSFDPGMSDPRVVERDGQWLVEPARRLD